MIDPLNSERHPVIPFPAPERVCIGCGCTDFTPCVDDGQACYWVDGLVDDGHVCSVCAAVAEALLEAEPGEPAPAPKIELYKPHEAQRFIEDTRAGRIARGVCA